jgi:hypothetical protein
METRHVCQDAFVNVRYWHDNWTLAKKLFDNKKFSVLQ